MLLNIIYLIIGLVLILVGANALTDGASAAARRLGVSDLVIGLTVVAFGTSAPELAISVISAINGNAELAVGNVVGSNIINILLIVGITAIVRPINVERNAVRTDIPFVILSAIVLLVMGNGRLLNGEGYSVISRIDGILLLLFLIIFMRYTLSQAKNTIPINSESSESDDNSVKMMPTWKSVVWIVGGLAGLIYGGDRFVEGAGEIARAIGVSDAVIGLTIVAGGTSLPELATSVTAALKGKSGIAIGNVIGSNIMNIFLILGCAATISPLPLGDIGNYDLLVMTGASVLFWIFARFFKRQVISRVEGVFMTLCYIAYISILLIFS